MDINDEKNKSNESSQQQNAGEPKEQGGIEHNNRPDENKQEDYVKDDQQSDLSYGRNNGRFTDSSTTE